MRLSDVPLQIRIDAGIKSCSGCGRCCLESPCILSMGIYGFNNQCPALFWNEEVRMYRCKLAHEFPERLYIGDACIMPENEWREDVRKRDGG